MLKVFCPSPYMLVNMSWLTFDCSRVLSAVSQTMMSHMLHGPSWHCSVCLFTAAAAPEDGGVNLERTRSRKSSNIFSRLFWSTKKAFLNFIKQFQDFMSSLFEMADKKVLGNEKGNLFERSLKACMMLAVVVLAIVVFKRSAVVRRGWSQLVFVQQNSAGKELAAKLLQ